MKRLTPSLLALGVAAFTAGPLAAEPLPLPELPGELSANVAITTDYRFRGFSQTDLGPAIQGGFDYGIGIFYLGTWASSVDFGDDTTMEIDFYGGIAPSIGPVDLDLGIIYYAYPDSPDEPDQEFIEYYAGAGTTLAEFLDVGVSVAYSDDFYLESGESFYTNLTAGVPLGKYFGLDGSYGISTFDEDGTDDYEDYSVGLTTSAYGLDLDLRYIGTSGVEGDPSAADDTVVFTVGKSF
ncbi:MAG: TorF family putative porin [Pseudomonadota bacterium]